MTTKTKEEIEKKCENCTYFESENNWCNKRNVDFDYHTIEDQEKCFLVDPWIEFEHGKKNN